MRVDIVIPCYNGERFLAQTLDTALGQTYRPIRVLVVDDGSTDATREIVESYGGRVGYVYKENGGQASARNLGISRTEGECVCLLDADDLLAPEMIERLVARLESRPEADLAHSQQLAIRGGDFAHPEAEDWRPGVEWDSYLEPLSVLCAIHGSATVFRRRAFERYGLLPETRSLQGCEDWHFWLQAVLQGAVIERVPDVLCLYRQHPWNSSSSSRAIASRESELMRAAVGLFERHGVRSERGLSALALGLSSVASRWLPLREVGTFTELYDRARSLAPPSFREKCLEPSPPGTAGIKASLLHLQLSLGALELGLPHLAAVLFLRCETRRELREQAARHDKEKVFERVVSAMAGVVASELDQARASGRPSYATHLASGLGLVARSAGKRDEARRLFVEALTLDPNNTRAALELIALDLGKHRFRPAISRWRRIAERDQFAVPVDLLSRVAWIGLRAIGMQETVRRGLQGAPQLRETARRVKTSIQALTRKRPSSAHGRGGAAGRRRNQH